MMVGGEGDKKEQRDYDFLSSVEVAVLDQADVFSMQNFAHVKAVFAVLNKIPYEAHGADFSRIRSPLQPGRLHPSPLWALTAD
jgi:U3 small nucleolar RNA-associated protein 25